MQTINIMKINISYNLGLYKPSFCDMIVIKVKERGLKVWRKKQVMPVL